MLIYTTSFESIEPTEKLNKYIRRKVRELERSVPLKVRESAHLTVHIKAEVRQKTCQAELHSDLGVLSAAETTGHHYAALDIVMAELRQQLLEYKAEHARFRYRKLRGELATRGEVGIRSTEP